MKSIKVIFPGVLLLVLLMSWVELAYSRPVAVKPRPSVRPPWANGGAGSTMELPNKQQVKLEYSIGMTRKEPEIITHAKKSDEKMTTDALANVMKNVNLVVKNTKSMSKKESDVLVQFLVDKSPIRTTNKTELIHNLNAVIQKHSDVAQSLKRLQENIQQNQMHLSQGQYGNLLIFVGSLKEISPFVPTKEVTAPRVLLNLGAHVDEMAIWQPKATREEAISLLEMYTRERAGASGPENALKSTLKHRGYTDVAKQLNRMKDIVENCKV